MASESASISIGIVLGNTSIKRGKSFAQITTGTLETANPYSGGNSVSTDASLLRTELPKANVPFGMLQKDGKTVLISPTWYRFFDFICNVQLGGPQAPTIADLSTATISTKTQAIAAQTSVADVSQQVNANAQALGAVVQVTQVSSLPGSNQIPPVVYSTPTRRGVQP
jgi:hypothetical protein